MIESVFGKMEVIAIIQYIKEKLGSENEEYDRSDIATIYNKLTKILGDINALSQRTNIAKLYYALDEKFNQDLLNA